MMVRYVQKTSHFWMQMPSMKKNGMMVSTPYVRTLKKMGIDEIIKINKKRWEIEECFRINENGV